MDVKIRKVNSSDLASIVNIYNQAILHDNCTCDTEACTVSSRTEWFYEHIEGHYPLFVCEVDEKVVGYGYLSAYRSGREALKRVAEISYYLDFSVHGMGIGSILLEFLIGKAKELGFRDLIAILLASNKSSINLLKKHKFELWGTMPEIALIANKTVDHLYYGIKL